MNLKNQKDLFSGLLFMAAGISFAWSAPRYTVGTAADMGPGYAPLLLGALLALLGWISVKVGGESLALPIAVMALAALLICLYY